ncbi:MAG: redoxin family protein, partial [Ferruginibacter sp.]|nr:redoxin family protein [Cytophagales bacterium]
MKLQTGQLAPDFTAEDVLGHPVRLHDLAGKKVYLSFLRNTDCPLCSLHVVKLIKVADQLKQNGTEVIVFYESGKPVVLASDFLRNQ